MSSYLVFLLALAGAPALALALAWHLRRDIPRYRRTGVWMLFVFYGAGFAWGWIASCAAPVRAVWSGGFPIFCLMGTAFLCGVVLEALRAKGAGEPRPSHCDQGGVTPTIRA